MDSARVQGEVRRPQPYVDDFAALEDIKFALFDISFT